MAKDISFFLQQYLYAHPFLVPLGLVGVWRWSTWLFKELVALRYRPEKGTYKALVSIVTPVYNEDPKIFLRALKSWKENDAKEIIAVIDYTDRKCIEVFKKFAGKKRWAKLIITRVPGKRPALALGIKKAKSEIVALVDSDTLWSPNVIKNGLAPFKNKKTAGVGTYQSVLSPKTLAQRIFDTQLDLRYCDEMPFLAAAGDALVCLSGRTAFYRRKIILPLLPELVNETFMGEKVISGDDKRLTYLVLEEGWRVAYQSNSHVYTPGMSDLKSYLKQRLRWTRNGIRADLKALRNGWPFRHPALIFFQLDKFAQALVIILSPIYFTVSLLTGAWGAALAIFCWWFISRGVKMYPHLKRKPKDIIILPAFVIYSFLTALIKVYAAFTLNKQGWITRWDKSRLPQVNYLRMLPGYLSTILVIFILIGAVFASKQLIFTNSTSPFNHQQKQELSRSTANQVLGAKTTSLEERKILAVYKVLPNDSITSIAEKFGTTKTDIINVNAAFLPNLKKLQKGIILAIPKANTSLPNQLQYNFQKKYLPTPSIFYNESKNTIEVSGRGLMVTIPQIKKAVPKNFIREVKKGEFILMTNLQIQNGVTLYIDKREVRWLKLSSDKKNFVHLGIDNGALIINGSRISSWDQTKKDVDKNYEDGRSYVVTNYAALISIENSEISYLGYPDANKNKTHGFSLIIPEKSKNEYLLTGNVKGSRFHDNFVGAYTSGAKELSWSNNRFYNNITHGFYADRNSERFIIKDNLVYGNGKYGILISNKSSYNTILRNNVYGNAFYGIAVADSEGVILKQNKLRINNIGIVLSHTNSNDIEENKILENDIGIRLDESNSNNINKNLITENKSYGAYFSSNANNNILNSNNLNKNNTAIYVESRENTIYKNNIQDNRTGIYFSDNSGDNKVVSNYISDNRLYKIFTKRGANQNVFVE